MIEFRPLQPPLRHIASPPHRHIPATLPLRKMSAARHVATFPKFHYSATPLLHRFTTPPNRHSSTRLSTTIPQCHILATLCNSVTPPLRHTAKFSPLAPSQLLHILATPPLLHSTASPQRHSTPPQCLSATPPIFCRFATTPPPLLNSSLHHTATCPQLCLATPSLRHSVRV